MNPETAKIQAQEIAGRYLRKAFDMPATTLDECRKIAAAATFYDLPCADEMISDLEDLIDDLKNVFNEDDEDDYPDFFDRADEAYERQRYKRK